jgi:hypothetical protein
VERRFRYPYWRLRQEIVQGFVRLVRTSTPYASLAELDASTAELVQALDALGRESTRLLVDLREGPMRSDPAFESKMNELRPKMFRGMARIAIVVATPLGALQVARHQRHDGIEWAVFNDDYGAYGYLGVRPARSEP